MPEKSMPHRFAALFIVLPLLGVLFSSVPWETDPRIENPEKRLKRLRDPRQAFLVDTLVSIAPTREVGRANSNGLSHWEEWSGLFPWEERDLAALTQGERLPGAELTLDEAARLDKVDTPSAFESMYDSHFSQTADVDSLLADGRNPNQVEIDRDTLPLEAMVVAGDMERTRALIAKNANPNVRDRQGRRPLILLIEKCRTGLAEKRLKACASRSGDRSCDEQKKDLEAARADDEKLKPMFELLLNAGAATNRPVFENEVSTRGFDIPAGQVMTMLAYSGLSCSESVSKLLAGYSSSSGSVNRR